MDKKINRDIYQDLRAFKETRRTVNELLNYKKAQVDIENSDFTRINEMKGKAIAAIDNLFKDV